jgi:hypothetical protein
MDAAPRQAPFGPPLPPAHAERVSRSVAATVSFGDDQYVCRLVNEGFIQTGAASHCHTTPSAFYQMAPLIREWIFVDRRAEIGKTGLLRACVRKTRKRNAIHYSL